MNGMIIFWLDIFGFLRFWLFLHRILSNTWLQNKNISQYLTWFRCILIELLWDRVFLEPETVLDFMFNFPSHWYNLGTFFKLSISSFKNNKFISVHGCQVKIDRAGLILLLLANGVKIDVKTTDEGLSSFMIACTMGDVQLAELLLARGASIHNTVMESHITWSHFLSNCRKFTHARKCCKRLRYCKSV